MKTVSIISLIAGFIILFSAKSAIHEIEAFLLFIISAIMVSAACIIESVKKSGNNNS